MRRSLIELTGKKKERVVRLSEGNFILSFVSVENRDAVSILIMLVL